MHVLRNLAAVLVVFVLAACGGGGPPRELLEQTGCVEQMGCSVVVAELAESKDVNGGDMWCIVAEQGGERRSGLVRQENGVWNRNIVFKAQFEEYGCEEAAEAAPM